MISSVINKYRYSLLTFGAIAIPLFFLPGAQSDPFLIPKKCLLFIIACAALPGLSYPIDSIFKNISKNLHWSLLVLLICLSLSIPKNIHIAAGIVELKRWVYLLIVFLTAACIKWDYRILKRFMIISIIVGSIISISVIYEYLGILPFYMFPFNVGRLYAFFGYQNIIGQYLIYPVLWGIGVYLCSAGYKEKIFVSICTALSIIALALTFCRGAIIGTAISAMLLMYLYKRISIDNHDKRKYIIILAIMAVIVIAGIFYSNIVTEGKTFHNISILINRGLSERMPLWTGAIDTIFNNPINGVGLGNYVLPGKMNAHNELLQMGAETGIVGILGILGFLLVVFKSIRKRFSLIQTQQVKLLHIALISGSIATLIHSMVSYNLHSSTSSYLFFIGLGILCSNEKSAIGRKSPSRKITVSSTIALPLIVLLSLWLVQFEYAKLAGHYSFNKAQVYFTKNNLMESSHHASKATHYQPDNPEYHILASRIYLKSKNVEQAEKHYQQAEMLMKKVSKE